MPIDVDSLLIVSGDDYCGKIRINVQELFQRACFSSIGRIVSQTVRYLYCHFGRRNTKIYLYVFIIIINQRFFGGVSVFSDQFASYYILQQLRFSTEKKQVKQSIIHNVSFPDCGLLRYG